MHEIFIPTVIPDILTIHEIPPGFVDLLKTSFMLQITPFESSFFRGLHITGAQDFQNFCITCNGTFGSEYFVDYDWENEKIVTLGHRFFAPDTIGSELQNIVSDFASIVATLSSDILLTHSKKEEIGGKIRHSFFLLAGVVFNISELLRKTRENISELVVIASDPEEKAEYRGNGALLLETLKTREIELSTNLSILEQKVAYFIDATKHFITP